MNKTNLCTTTMVVRPLLIPPPLPSPFPPIAKHLPSSYTTATSHSDCMQTSSCSCVVSGLYYYLLANGLNCTNSTMTSQYIHISHHFNHTFQTTTCRVAAKNTQLYSYAFSKARLVCETIGFMFRDVAKVSPFPSLNTPL